MHKRLLCTVAIAGILAVACNDNASETDRKNGFSDQPKTTEDSLYSAVMEGHNVGMAKIISVKRYNEQAQQAIDSMNKVPAEKQDRLYYQSLVDVQSALSIADASMDSWMTAFNPDTLREDKGLRIKYLQSEVDKVTIVKKQILDGLEAADSLFNKK